MIQQIRKHPISKVLSIFLIYCLLLPIVLIQQPVYGQAGPSQSETTGFTLGSTSGMVDEFTGDFSYSIPLLDVDGYPITISYNSNVTMFQDASWVGLGWDLNVGSVSRDMRGIPDDFNGEDKVQRSIGMKDYETEGSKNGGGLGTILGGGMRIGLSAVYGTYMNSYNGKGTTWDFGVNSSVNVANLISFNWGVGFSMDSQNGVGRNNSIGLGNWSLSQQFNSRQGLYSTTLGRNLGIPILKSNSFNASISTNMSATYSLGTPTSVPRYQLPRFGENESTTTNVNALLSFSSFHLSTTYTNVQYELADRYKHKNQTLNLPAYGYYHLGKGQNKAKSNLGIMDFNRENDSEFSEEMANLTFSAPTYDFFNVSAMGIGGSVRGYRNDIGTFSDPTIRIENQGTNENHNIYVGYAVPVGFSVGYAYSKGDVTSEGSSGRWENFSERILRWNHQEKDGIEKNVFFKAVGEKTPRNMQLWNAMGGSTPSSESFLAIGGNIMVDPSSTIRGNYMNFLAAPKEREVRANYYRPMTGQVYFERSPLNERINYFIPDQWMNPSVQEIPRVGGVRKGHHISAIEAVSENGINYHFDIPVYNIEQSEIVFNASGLSGNQNFNTSTSSGNIVYSSQDNSWNNNRGRNGFYEKTKTPGYAHSYLLSLMTSSDYIDRTGNGPTTDDFGNYYKFNYTRIYSENSPYKWRFPYETNSAKLNQGHLSTPFDDIATYSYGEKEIWYARSIETKNYIVEFHLNDPTNSPRKDGYGVNGENGGLNANQPLRYLEKVVLYNRNDRIENGMNAIPVKVVSFKYDYSLCKGTPSNSNTSNGISSNSGKLTLKSIHFSGGNSELGKLAPYEFTYEAGNSFDNPDFSYLNVDRWGMFKKNDTWNNNIDYPEASQDDVWVNEYAQAWKLKSVRTPSNGTISVAYEADRFAHTQDKEVMRMIRVKGMTNVEDFILNGASNMSNQLVDSGDKKNPNIVVFFELDEPLTGSQQDQIEKLKNEYLKTEKGAILKELFFQFRVMIHPTNTESYENIIGFSNILSDAVNLKHNDITKPAVGVVNHGGEQLGYLCLLPVDIKDKEGSSGYMVNPIQKTAWQYARLSIPDVVYGNCTFNWSNPQVTDCDYSNDIDAKVAFGKDINKALNEEKYCRYIDLSNSFIRTYDPRGYKYGGNARVKSITYSDNWNEMSTEEKSSYTWEYQYEHWVTGPTGRDVLTYTGVAAYEPIIGKTVNPFYTWSTYKNEIKQFPDDTRYNTEPVGELLFPAPIVGYSKVKVKFGEINNVTQNTVGESVTEFHTAKDFPTIVERTIVDRGARVKKNNIFTSKETRLNGLSQGYLVVTNDFHGKVKASRIVDRDRNQVQKSTYHYSSDNSVKTLDRDGTLRNETIATEYDIYSDARYVENESNMFAYGGGAIVTYVPPFIFSLSLPFDISSAKTRKGFYVHTFTKHLNRNAVLERVETTYLGSKNSAENLVRDRYSGEVIVSSLNDEFNDKLYAVSYPAHWYYPNLQNRYISEDFELENVLLNNGELSFGGSNQPPLVSGDVVLINRNGLIKEAWALTGGEGGSLIQLDGSRFNTVVEQVDVQLFKSGRQNRITEKMMQVTTKSNPVNGSEFIFPKKDILSVSAVEYDFNYNIPCFEKHNDKIVDKPGDYDFVPGTGQKVNPFVRGLMGTPYIINQLAFQSEREVETDGIRKDAELLNYKPFYGLNGGKWFKIYENGHPDYVASEDYQEWRELQQLDKFDEFAKAQEAIDPLGVSASVLYGYNKKQKMLPIAQAVNAKSNQIVFESFDDNIYAPSSFPVITAFSHFDFLEEGSSGVSITKETRHSGVNSLKIAPGKRATVRRISSVSCSTPADDRTVTGEYVPEECDCIQQFSPLPGEYVLSTWVKKNAPEISYSNVSVTVGAGGTVYTLTPTGPILEGWQRVEGRFMVPAQQTAVTVSVSNTSSTDLFIDDFRIHPVQSEMSTTVYDPDNLLPIATHDGNNFTTFYNYDENNQLVRVRIETIEGIKTISETQTGIRKRYTGN